MKMVDRGEDGLGLVRDAGDLHTGGQDLLHVLEGRIHLLAELRDVVPSLHFHGDDQCGLAIITDHRIVMAVFTDDRCDILEPYVLACRRGDHDEITQSLLGMKRFADADWHLKGCPVNAEACRDVRIALEQRPDCCRLNPVVSELMLVDCHADDLLLFAEAPHLGRRRNSSQVVF